MTEYRGPLSVQLSGVAEGQGTFVASFVGSYRTAGARVIPGRLPGFSYASGDGTVTVTVTTPAGVETSSTPVNLPTLVVFLTDPPSVLVSTTLPQYGISVLSGSNSLNATGTLLTVSQTGSFDAVIDGVRYFGTMTASGSLAATGSAYSIAALDVAGAEGTGPDRAYTFTVERRGNAADSGSIGWHVAGNGPAQVTGADFAGGQLPAGRLDFAPGEVSKTLTVTALGDATFEPDEGFIVRLENAADELIVVTSSVVATVANDDVDAGVVSIAALDANRVEGTAGPTDFTFTLSRTGASTVSANVDWQVAGSGLRPANPADFVGGALPSGTVTFAAGETSKTLTVAVAGDALREGHERFTVSLVSRSGVELGAASVEAEILSDEPIDDILLVAAATGLALPMAPQFYAGPVAGLERELIADSPENLTVITSGPNWFVRTGGGDDAIAVAGGRNVLDGGFGSNFLTGAGGSDTFFLDARDGSRPLWSTLVGFGPGDDVTIWGVSAETAALIWQENQGAPGFTGLTLHAQAPGHAFASLTLPGFTLADLESGQLTVTSVNQPSVFGTYLHLAWA